MSFYEKLKRFGELISELAGVYGEMSDDLPQLHFVGACDVPAKSEVKKMPLLLYRFQTARRTRRAKAKRTPQNCGNKRARVNAMGRSLRKKMKQ